MKKYFGFYFAAAWVIFLLAGCGPDDPNPPDNGSSDDDPASSGPVRGDWIRVYQPSDPDALHPYASTHAAASYVKENLYQYLYELNPHTKQLEPVLVKGKAEVSEDGLKYTFEFRDEAVWDNGEPMTGEDFEFSMKCVANPLSEAQHIRTYYGFLKDVKVDPNNPKRFTAITDEPFFLAETAIAGIEVISKKYYDPNGLMDDFTVRQLTENGDALVDNRNLVRFSEQFHDEKYKRDPEAIYGSGPYKLESWISGDNITLVRKENWWGDKLRGKGWAFQAWADKIVFKTITDRVTAIRAAAAGEVDVIRDIPGDEFIKIRKDKNGAISKNFNLHTPDTYSYVYLGLNGRPPAGRTPYLEDPKVRKAIAHITDVQKIVDKVYSGFGTPIVGPISPHNVNEYHTGLKPVPFDPEAAKKLLDEAGWIDSNGNGIRDKEIRGKRVEFEIEFMVSNSSKTAPRLAAMVSAEAKKVGMIITVNRVEFGTLTSKLKTHEFDMFGAGFNGSPLPKDLYQVWHTESWVNRGSNYFGFGNEYSDSLIETIRVTVDADKRKPMYEAIQEMIQDWQPAIFIYAPQERIIIHKRFKDAKATVVRPGYKISEFWAPKAEQRFGKEAG